MEKVILCAGEVLFDLISMDIGQSIAKSRTFQNRMGGSPFNVCCGLAALEAFCMFFTQLGDDSFGKEIFDRLKARAIDTRYTFVQEGAKTSLAFVGVDAFGKADYEFYRKNTADVVIKEKAVDEVRFEDITFFHFGSLAIVDEPGAKAYLKLFAKAKKNHVYTAFDPNVRPFYIKDKERYQQRVWEIIAEVDVLKCSDEDLFFLTGESNPEKALSLLPQKNGRMDFVTLGPQGCLIHHDGLLKQIKGYRVPVADTVGCGDAFMAGILKVINQGLSGIEKERFALMEEAARFAVACAAIVANREGAADAMPTEREVMAFLDNRNQ